MLHGIWTSGEFLPTAGEPDGREAVLEAAEDSASDV